MTEGQDNSALRGPSVLPKLMPPSPTDLNQVYCTQATIIDIMRAISRRQLQEMAEGASPHLYQAWAWCVWVANQQIEWSSSLGSVWASCSACFTTCDRPYHGCIWGNYHSTCHVSLYPFFNSRSFPWSVNYVHRISLQIPCFGNPHTLIVTSMSLSYFHYELLPLGLFLTRCCLFQLINLFAKITRCKQGSAASVQVRWNK